MTRNTESGRMVVNVSPELKRRLYAELALSGCTLKEWFERSAEEYCVRGQYKTRSQDSRVGGCLVSEEPDAYGALMGNGVLDSTNSSKYKLVSMFSGCGGMDLGFKGGFTVFDRHYHRLPFDTVWANDLNEKACQTFRLNLKCNIHHGDVSNLLGTLPQESDVLIGGFPCQDISVNGKRAGVNGARSGLYKAMIKAVELVGPKVFVAENVGALLRHKSWLKQVLKDFESLGYTMHYQSYQAADYGVPQTRERVFFVGTAPSIRTYCPPIPERNASTWMTASAAIGDLASTSQKPEINHIWSLAKKSPEQGNRRLQPNRPGYTIRAECHGNIQFHYALSRRISMREAARLQSFPDDFIFASGLRETERQVGNAVPPILAWHVAQSVLNCLNPRIA